METNATARIWQKTSENKSVRLEDQSDARQWKAMEV